MKLSVVGFAQSGICGILAFTAIAATAQSRPSYETDLENSRASTSLIVADIRPKLFGDLPPAELQIYNQIQFSVSSEDKIMNAYATHTGGVRRVVLTEAMGRATELNTDAFLMEQLYNKPGFLGDYMSFVCERYQANRKRYAQGLPPSRIPSPYEFAHWTDSDINEFYSNKAANKARNIAVGGAFSFLLAHEVAHHVKGHVDHPTSSLSERRAQEEEADGWAIDLLVKKKLNPVDGIIPLLFFYFTDQNPVSNEENSDHPADERRLLKMYEGLSQRLPSFKPYLPGQDYDTARQRVDLALSLVRAEVAAGEKGRDARRGGGQTATASDSRSLSSDAAASSLCDGLNSYTDAARHNFSSLRGAPDPDSGGEGFGARQGISGFTDCTVWIYKDRSVSPSTSCDKAGGDFQSLRTAVQSCLGSGWSFRTRPDEYIFEQPQGVAVRLRRKSSGLVELWVDSPSRD
jgi:hypothetical protein